ncbi:YetF domain-containing protein [Paramaledivibacter caminithermalis]|jgi:uncharacterized membrane protein YcaP (DUF421 family)|uniref:Uncharacterized membrane protein YcaP, DUF421 family n=1 Tax=Paramaledivibacter caminithermalis (strain DSM 15212 / CIP 107654 / DViRD3) TaxID=1121301 RepID=A0A1M6SI69_PARC5|nr:DUF421 domain-containing protein [Paramaledivibacter caminithermalis]SHK44431.1 Uncharacterized membrane protein YcaP, DUF421 family [Paramaledivibacter caminithermalis DSM 15212]
MKIRFVYTVIELIIGFMALFIITKIIGRRQLSQIAPFDFISAIVLGELLGNAIYDKEVGIFYILSTLLIWAVLMLIVEMLTQKYSKLRGFLEGNPSIVIRNGLIDRKELKKNKIDINELLNLLRQKDVFSIREVEYGILEANGKLSILKKSKYTQPNVEDLNLQKKPVYLPVTLINDGEVLWDNLKNSGFEENWLQKQLQLQGFNNVKEVFYAEWKQDEGIHVVPLNINNANK